MFCNRFIVNDLTTKRPNHQMEIPIIVVCYNNHRYVDNTLRQLKSCNPDLMNQVRIMDSKSTDPDTVAFLKSVSVPVIWNPTNSGPWLAPWVNADVYHSMPERFILTDPDLQLNPELPSDFVEQLCKISDRHQCAKVGFALDISDSDKMYPGRYSDGKRIWEWESRFWKDRVEDDEYEIYRGAVDTTFSLHDKRWDYYHNQMRVAGKFTAKHIPWYVNNPFYNNDELFAMYKNKPFSTFGRVVLATIDPQATTFVTALIRTDETKEPYRSVDTYLAEFDKLVKTGINLHVFVSPSYEKFIPFGHNIQTTVISLEDLDTYKELQGLQYRLPQDRNESKDTERYLILMNAKTELLERSIKLNFFENDQYAWVDFGIFHIFKDSIDESTEKLRWLGKNRLDPGLYIPGCHKRRNNPFPDKIFWRFCGGFFIGDRASIIDFNAFYRRDFKKIVEYLGCLTWEVNIWAYMEHGGFTPRWYPADHNTMMLDIPKKTTTTLVTFYFNLKDLPDATGEVRPRSFYMDKGRDTLSLSAPMVIFCDETCYDDIKKIRGDRPTHYVVKSFFESDFYKTNFPIIKNNRADNPVYKDSRNTVSYSLLIMFKLLALQQAQQIDPFGATHYAWIDFGGSHVLSDFTNSVNEIVKNPRPKVSMCYIHYRGNEEMTLTSDFARGGRCGVAATCFTVERDYVPRLYTGCMSIFYELLTSKLYHAEEQVMTYFYHRYPELCTLYYGDYYSTASNYHYIRDDYPSVKQFFMLEALNKNRSDLAYQCAYEIMYSIEEGRLQLPQEEIDWLVKLWT